MNKRKIILAALISFQTSNHIFCNDNSQNISSIVQNSQITELLNSLDLIQKRFVTEWIVFANQDKQYPNMSLSEFGDKIIDILNTSGQNLPDNIRNSLINIVEIKKRSSSFLEFNSGDAAITNTMILLIDTLLGHLHHETSNLLKLGVSVQEIATVKRALTAMRKKFDDFKRSGDHCTIGGTIEKLTTLINQLEPIVISQLKRHKIDLQNNNSDSPKMPVLSKLEIYRLISERIK